MITNKDVGVSAGRSGWLTGRLLVSAGSLPVAAMLVVGLMVGLLPVAFVVATSRLLGQVPAAVRGGSGSGAEAALFTSLIAAAVILGVQQVLIPVQYLLGELAAYRVDGIEQRRLMAAALDAPVAVLEGDGPQGDLRVAAQELEFGVQSPGQAVAGTVALVARYTQLAGFVVLIGVGFSWWAAAGTLGVVAAFRYGQVHGLRQYAQVRAELSGSERRIDYLRRLSIEPAAGPELRVFGLAAWCAGLLAEAYTAWLGPLWAARRRVYLWPFVAYSLVGAVVLVAVLAAFGASSVDERSVATFVLVVQAVLGALRLAEHYPEADLQTAVGLRAALAVDRFAAQAGPRTDEGDTPIGSPEREIRFDDVSFRYPGRDTPVIDHLDLTLPAGRCTAVVGVNGAGKTTLVKLLTRLYEPDSGTIRVDGTDIAAHPAAGWRRRVAVIFQDFARFEVSAADNIGFGAVWALDDRAGIAAAAVDAGADRVTERLPGGPDVPLARHLAGGTSLSGGQWQRIALARALFAMRHGSSVLVLDEPTAALDVRAEARFFEEFRQVTAGATTVLISHRFSTVRHADQIVVLDGGRVVEQGDHQQLLAADGQYAAMFHAQAHRFTEPQETA
ncbi:ATP-binding cassette domain-containing protein [Kineosporia sp. NBRC 101731]|uniref:ABC transporter ATP-binding protein n=1 Tax=Kineosporia sp. NBRC 101731 TaxID=3032199 RepID=UPI00249FF24C|nr:ATP-binding cassette domain-containing protein [Kineosporia sp. NBRC 101731]GLY29545.1 multidrug ABC transporter permease [Kineosporia sp. NBRC 101731]